MTKIVILLSLFLSSIVTYSQVDSLVFKFDSKETLLDSTKDYIINYRITSKFTRDISIVDSIKGFSVFCLDFAPIRIEIQELDSNCYVGHSPDCAPLYNPTQKPIPLKTLHAKESIEYTVSINSFLNRVVNNFTEKRQMAFRGNYRIRIHLDYFILSQKYIATSKWNYINF